jgi:hypothetical protein
MIDDWISFYDFNPQLLLEPYVKRFIELKQRYPVTVTIRGAQYLPQEVQAYVKQLLDDYEIQKQYSFERLKPVAHSPEAVWCKTVQRKNGIQRGHIQKYNANNEAYETYKRKIKMIKAQLKKEHISDDKPVEINEVEIIHYALEYGIPLDRSQMEPRCIEDEIRNKMEMFLTKFG